MADNWKALPFPVDGPNGMYCLVDTQHGKCLKVFLYGTDHKSEWRKHYPDRWLVGWKKGLGLVNLGYYRFTLDVYRWICYEFALEFRGTVRVLVAGHSLGGAMAQILGVLLRNRFRVPTLVVTFGTIRAGWLKDKALMLLNYVRTNDVTWMFPPLPWYRLGGAIQWVRSSEPWWNLVKAHNDYHEVIRTAIGPVL